MDRTQRGENDIRGADSGERDMAPLATAHPRALMLSYSDIYMISALSSCLMKE